MDEKKSSGVGIVSVIFIIIAILMSIYGFTHIVSSYILPEEFKKVALASSHYKGSSITTIEQFDRTNIEYGAGYLLFAIIWLISAVGILKRKNRARLSLFILFTIYFLWTSVRVLIFKAKYSQDFIIFLVIYIFSLIFFNYPKIKEQFK